MGIGFVCKTGLVCPDKKKNVKPATNKKGYNGFTVFQDIQGLFLDSKLNNKICKIT